MHDKKTGVSKRDRFFHGFFFTFEYF